VAAFWSLQVAENPKPIDRCEDLIDGVISNFKIKQ